VIGFAGQNHGAARAANALFTPGCNGGKDIANGLQDSTVRRHLDDASATAQFNLESVAGTDRDASETLTVQGQVRSGGTRWRNVLAVLTITGAHGTPRSTCGSDSSSTSAVGTNGEGGRLARKLPRPADERGSAPAVAGLFGVGPRSVASGVGAGGLPSGVGSGTPIGIDGLWNILFGNGESLGDADTLYFAAGPADEKEALFGALRVAR
jgi:hypothetical protein